MKLSRNVHILKLVPNVAQLVMTYHEDTTSPGASKKSNDLLFYNNDIRVIGMRYMVSQEGDNDLQSPDGGLDGLSSPDDVQMTAHHQSSSLGGE